jgi:hypothetical protein
VSAIRIPIVTGQVDDATYSHGLADLTVTFVIPVRDDAERLARCLRSIAANHVHGVDVLVVDNGSTDQSVRVAMTAGARVLEQADLTISGLRNAGARAARGRVLAFVDADHEIAADWVRTARSVFADEDAVAAGAPCTNPGRTWVQRVYDGVRRRPPARSRTKWLGAGNLAVRRMDFLSAGGFDERLETCEDVDLCRRFRAAGGAIIADPALKSVHLGDPETLGGVFTGELWRGRDNLAVSFRQPFDWRCVASALVPAVLLAAAGGLPVWWIVGDLPLFATCAIVLSLPVLARALRICSSLQLWGVVALGQSLAVAAAYETGRALALVAGAPHRTRRGGVRNAA